MITIGKVSKMFGISRTTLLYYDKIGLISPTSRNESGYRLYNQTNITRLKHIFILKNAGVPLNQINALISADEPIVFGQLMKRLGELNLKIEELRRCQNYIISILNKTFIAKNISNQDAQTIEKIISYAEINLDKKDLWHQKFEKQSPEQHEYFLSVFGLNSEEIDVLKNRIN